MIKRRLAALIMCVCILAGAGTALAAAGGAEDPLISLSFMGEYTASVLSRAKAVFSQALSGVFDEASAEINGAASTGRFTGARIASGGTVRLGMGGSVILLSGSGSLSIQSGEVVDVTAGETVQNGAALSTGRRYMAVEDTQATVNVISAASALCDGDATVSQTGSTQVFADVPESYWGYPYINELYGKKLVGGVGNGLFNPTANMTRADFVTVLGRLHGVDVSAYSGVSFTDVPSGRYYAPYVSWASESGLVGGYGGGRFGLGDNITRGQMAAVIVRYARFSGISLPSNGSENVFEDDARIQSWAREDVYTAMRAGLVGGKGGNRFDPEGFSSRAEICAIISRLINL